MATKFKQGIDVTGTITATTFSGDGSALTGVSGGNLAVQDEGSALSTGATTLNFVGSGVTASGTGSTKTITIAGGSSQNTFSTIASNGQNDIVADGPTDKLYIEAGSGISIATDENTDTLTITATGGGGGSDVVDDTTPQLGGDLDLNSKSITGGQSNGTTTNLIKLGATGDELYIYSGTGTTGGYIRSQDNNLNLSAGSGHSIELESASGNVLIGANNLGSSTAWAQLNYGDANAEKLRTTANGIQVTGSITSTASGAPILTSLSLIHI